MARLESDMEGQTNTSFRQWLGTMESWQWAQSFDEGFRYGQMTTNLVEGINVMLLKTRHLPISFVFSAMFYRLATLMLRMGQQQVNQMEAGHVFVEDISDAMVVNRRMVRSMTVEGYIFVELDVHVVGDYGHQRSPQQFEWTWADEGITAIISGVEYGIQINCTVNNVVILTRVE
ncbi:hypothetical protein GOBAR_DD16924 [Gossypium barbadense]|nr:hypothetical protein GOBAR_DD16924 [Gossypium barbadense]